MKSTDWLVWIKGKAGKQPYLWTNIKTATNQDVLNNRFSKSAARKVYIHELSVLQAANEQPHIRNHWVFRTIDQIAKLIGRHWICWDNVPQIQYNRGQGRFLLDGSFIHVYGGVRNTKHSRWTNLRHGAQQERLSSEEVLPKRDIIRRSQKIPLGKAGRVSAGSAINPTNRSDRRRQFAQREWDRESRLKTCRWRA